MRKKESLHLLQIVFSIFFCLAMSTQLISQCAPTQILTLGNGDDGEIMAFNPNDGLIYHGSGNGTRIFESIDLTTSTINPILLSGANAGELRGLVWYPPLNAFVGGNGNNLNSITTTGVVTFLSNISSPAILRGYALDQDGSSLWGVSPFGEGILQKFNPITGSVLETIPLTQGGNPVTNANGIIRHPVTGEYNVIYGSGGNRRFGAICITTGVITDLGALGDRFAGITVDNTGQFYGVTGDGASTPETLFTINCTGSLASACPPMATPDPIPTMSEWGVLLFGLLILNLSVFFIRRKEGLLFEI